MVNTEPCSMGGIVDYGVSITTKSSPRSVAIEKAQEELRQEYDVREERRRELEFLEKGGNPLDFKFGHVESVSMQSTSITDQIAEQNVISEAKGSFVFAASPHGDSVESSGKPGSSLCRETNTADNLMLFGGDNNDSVKEKIVKRGSRRTNAAQLSQSSDSHNNAKKAEDSGLSRLGMKSQAYVRRNRSKPCRESANVASIISPVVPAKGSEPKDAKGAIKEKQPDDIGVLSGSSLNQAGPKCDQAGPKCEDAPKSTASDEYVAMELDGIQTIRENCCIVKSETRQGDNNSKATEGAPNGVNDNQPPDGFGEIAATGASTETPDATSEVVLRTSCSSASRHNERETCADDEKVDGDHLDKGMAHNHVGELDNSSIIPVCAVQATSLHKSTMDPPCEDMTSIIDNLADGNNLVATKIDRKSHEDVDSRISIKGVKEGGQLEGFCGPTSVKENSSSVQPEVSTTVHIKDEMEVCDDAVVAQKDRSCPSPGHSMNNERSPALEKINSRHGDSNTADPIVVGSALITLPDSMPSLKVYGSSAENEIQKSGENLNKMATKEYEDSILRKACLIEVGLKSACERSLCNISLEKRRKGHWDFVLEEMAWMANDFMQERLWRSMAASQVCHWIASDGLAKFDQASIQRKQKTVIKSLAKGVMSFWRSAEALLTTGGTAKVMETYDSNMMGETKPTGIKAENEQGNESMETEQSMRPRRSQIQDYAVRFLEYNSHTSDSIALAEAPRTPDRLSDFGILKVSDQLSQGSLFYAVPAGAMLAYRESVESLFMYHKRAGNIEVKYDYEASVCDSAADLTQENAYEEDEGKTFTYLLPEAYDGGLLSKMGHKKKHIVQQRMNGARPYEVGTDVPYEPCLESKSGNRQLFSNGKRPSSSFLAIPTKRIRTAARQRVVSPFPASVGGTPQVTSKTDVSSGDSYQDDQSSLHGGSLPWKNMDYESTVDFDRQLPYDGSEAWTKANKKKKHKNPGHKTAQNAANSCASAPVKGRIYDQRSQVDFTQYEQKDYLKRRSETQQFYSNGTIVANGGQHASKKLKMMRQGVDISQEASPVASQMSNMANPAKIIKIITNRDHGRKVKALKMSSGGGWSNFEDQALVVLVHDMGQNWELVSDAINSIVQFKSVHRQPKECKERHKVLVDRSSGDGADSAEDSGSSQHYHFTIPGIPKGSARQLFRRLQGPFEEENLKSHFEKIILLMPQVQSRRRQVNSREPKPIVQPHSSHVVALSQACPNNLSGGTLSPFDLCDAISSNLDTIVPSHTNGLTLPNHHGSVGPTTPTSNPNSRLPGSPGMVLGSNLPSPSTSTAPSRDAQKYGVPRSTSLQGDEQQKIQYQYNQVVSGRNLHQPGGSVAGTCPGVDRGARMMPGAHGIGMTTGVNRGMPAARAGFPRVSSPGMPNMVSPGNMLSNNGQGVPNAVRVHSGATSAPGNSILRPRDPMQMLRPGQHMEEHRQMVKPEFHMQVSQGSSQAVQFSSMNPSFSNAAASLPVQQTQKPHQMSQPSHMFGNPQGTSHSSPQQQQGYVMHLGKERQFQQRMVPQQHNDLSGASAVPSVQNGSQIQQQNQASAATSTPSSQPRHQRQQSEQHPPDSSALPNQPANATQPKQKKQQGQQQPRQNQQQRNQGSQQAKLMKSLGRGNMLIPQTPPVDATPASAVSTPSKKQVTDKNLMQHGQGSSPGNKASISSGPQHGNQHKLYTSPLPQSPKEMPDIGNQDLMQGSPSHTLLAPQQPPLHSKSPLTTQQRQINPSQNIIKRMMMQQNLQMNSDRRTDSQLDQVQHNQVIPTPPISHDTEPGSPGLSSINQRKHEASTSKLLSSPKDNFVGNETSLPSSSQDAVQRQISGGLPMHAQDVGGQWHQQQSREHLQSPHHQQPQHQQRPAVQGSLYAPSNSGPG